MLISRHLKMAFLLSLVWHLFWMSFVSIEFLPSKIKPRRHGYVNFLGSILLNPLSVAQVSVADEKNLVKLPSAVKIRKQSYFSKRLHPSIAADREVLNLNDLVDIDFSTETISSLDALASKDTVVAKREVIFKPPLLKYPEWMQQGFRGSHAIFKIYICADGLVEQVVSLQASGNPEIDAVLARYISRWRFAAVSDREGQWQTVTINLDFDDSTPVTFDSEGQKKD